jgi:tRNA G18 (ribose-2'-O)-methylase SpoU
MDIIEITDINAPELDFYRQQKETHLLHYYEPDLGVFIAESPKVIERAVKGGYTPMSILCSRKDINGEAAGVIETANVPVYTADDETITALTGFKLIRGALCAMRRNELPAVSDICRDAKRIAVLENVVNPTNVGAIFRSAAALGMDAVILTESCSDPLYRRSSRVSMGTVFQVPWTFMSGNNTDMELLHSLGFKTAAMALEDDSVDIDDEKLNSEEKLAVILGAEGDGLSSDTIRACDYTVCIPMSHEVDSLNVAAASAVAFYQLAHLKR